MRDDDKGLACMDYAWALIDKVSGPEPALQKERNTNFKKGIDKGIPPRATVVTLGSLRLLAAEAVVSSWMHRYGKRGCKPPHPQQHCLDPSSFSVP